MVARAAAIRAAGVAAAVLALPAATPGAAAQVPPQGTFAFVDVSVIPMTREGLVLRGQTVVVRNGLITAVGPSAGTPVPDGATRIEGAGRYLIPGLAEMHGHVVWNAPQGYPTWPEDVAFLYVAAGATTVRGMQGHPLLLEQRERIVKGEWVGPRLFLSGPPLSGNNVPDAATAERLVREQKAAGYDLLKVHEGLTRDAYDALTRTARAVGIPWGGHVSVHVGVPGALAAGQATIDHLDDYVDAAQRDGSPALAMTGADRVRELPLHVDPAKIPELARQTREAGVAVVPTQVLWEVLRGAHDSESMRDRPELAYVPPPIRMGWVNAVDNIRANTDRTSARRKVEFRDAMLKALADAGVAVLMGTDAPQIFSVPGFSLFREIRKMSEIGLTNWQILESGTVAVARHLGIGGMAGTVEPGRYADLILLDANPLEDIMNVERRAGVMVYGRWLSRAEIDRRLEQLAARYRA
jgi:imidazolonepropionase-like amidohydrolase